MTKAKPTADGFTYPQRRILSAVMDLFDTGSSVVTVSDVYTRLASESPPVSEREIRTQLDVLSPTYVTQVRPEVRLHAAAWSKMKRVPVPAPTRAPSTPIEQAVVAQPVPIAAPVVAPALREKPATPVRRPSAPLSLEPRGAKPKIEVVQHFEVGDPEAFKRAIGASPEALDALEGSKSATDAPIVIGVEAASEVVPNLLEAAPEPVPPLVVPPLGKPTVTFPRREGETLVQLCRRYVEACGTQGTTADEAQEATGRDLGPTLSDLTSRGTLIGIGSGVGARNPSTPRRRWYLPQFVPSSGVATAPRGASTLHHRPQRAVSLPSAPPVAPVVAYGGASTLVVSPELVDPVAAYDQRIAEMEQQYAELRAQHDKVTDELANITAALGFDGEPRKLLAFAGEVAKERDEARKALDAATTLHENWKRHIHSALGVKDDDSIIGAWRKMVGDLNDAYEARDAALKRVEHAENARDKAQEVTAAWVNWSHGARKVLGANDGESLEVAVERLRNVLAPAEGQTMEDRARQLNTQIAATWFHLGAGKEGQTIDERAAAVMADITTAIRFPPGSKLDDMLKEIAAFAYDRDAGGIGGIMADVCDVLFEDPDRAATHSYDGVVEKAKEVVKENADLHHAVDHALHVLSSNLPPDCCPVQGSPESSTAADLVAMADAAANTLASIPDRKVREIRMVQHIKVEDLEKLKRAIADAGPLHTTILMQPDQTNEDLLNDFRRSVVGDLARALNVQVEHTDPGEAYFWLLDVARNRVPLDLGIDLLIDRELTKHEARMKALRVAYKIAKASS